MMNFDYNESSSEDKDIKPFLNTNFQYDHIDENSLSPEFNNSPKKWSPGTWQDGQRKSAFLPYKQQSASCTVLTNLQRGNTHAATPVPQTSDINFHTRAGQGEITEDDVKNEKYVDIWDNSGLTALHWAAAYGQINSVKLLVSYSANIEEIGPEGETPLLFAANGGHHEVVRFLLSKGANLQHVDDVGNTALMYAASKNHPYTCNELLLKGANISVSNHCNQTAFDLAANNGCNLAQAIIENHILELLK